MKAWEKERQIMDEAIPRILSEEEQTWLEGNEVEVAVDNQVLMLWNSNVPGSFAPESIMTAAVQSIENMGYEVEGGMDLINSGFEAIKNKDYVKLHKISAKVWHEVNNAKKIEDHPYWKFKHYKSFQEHCESVAFDNEYTHALTDLEIKSKLYAGWIAQIIGGAVGTAIEGYTAKNIKETFGPIRNYVRKPNTYNDDITFEIAFLKAYEEKGSAITSEDVALSWVGYVPMGWSAEDIAIRNIRSGIFPPLSGSMGNPFSDWIGAQMRGAICGQLTPGDPREACRLAWIDGVVSHANNGVLGETFNAMLVALSFVEKDARTLLEKTIALIPSDSEYYRIVTFAHNACKENESWEKAWALCEEEFKEYNWIHAYPNAMAEVVALYYGNTDFEETLHIIAMVGQDVDCNAAQILTAVGQMVGIEGIDSKWTDPIGDELDTYLRAIKKLSIKELSDMTFNAIEARYKRG